MEAITSVTSLASIREIQFRDNNGNLISEPDASNPSRPKFERPLDTIRGFEERIRRAEREERAAFIRAGKDNTTMAYAVTALLCDIQHVSFFPFLDCELT